MRIPIIRHVVKFIQKNDEDYVHEALELLEYLAEAKGIKDEELDVIGEIISNLHGAIEVNFSIKNGLDEKVALNRFMGRVIGSIDD